MRMMYIHKSNKYLQSNFNGSNTFRTMKISSRQGKFEPMKVACSARSGGNIGIIFSIFFHMKTCVFSLESPHRGDSNEYTQHAIVNIKKKITFNYPKYNNVCSYGIFP